MLTQSRHQEAVIEIVEQPPDEDTGGLATLTNGNSSLLSRAGTDPPITYGNSPFFTAEVYNSPRFSTPPRPGIIFVKENGDGPGVRMRKAKK